MLVKDFVRQCLPHGTNRVFGPKKRGGHQWAAVPAWPPDMFAVTALLVERCSLYTVVLDPSCALKEDARHDARVVIAEAWESNDWLRSRSCIRYKRELQAKWDILLGATASMGDRASGSEPWVEAALELLIIADHASGGIGFFPGPRDSGEKPKDWVARLYLSGSYRAKLGPSSSGGGKQVVSKQAASTVCLDVPETVACVQPKTRTPRVGCSLRSMSHHLSLLPPSGVVATHWNTGSIPEHCSDSPSFNLLAVPFPYRISGNDFRDVGRVRNEESAGSGLFGVQQSWLDRRAVNEFADFIKQLIADAEKDVERVDAVVLPELALDSNYYRHLVEALAKDTANQVQFVVAGVLGGSKKSDPAAAGAAAAFRNAAVTTVFTCEQPTPGAPRVKLIESVSQQLKHHRWKVDQGQIVQYSLGSALHPDRDWWENADISERGMAFYVFRRGASFTTLVCEDLARSDPGLGVVRAIGPNLVIALLMDGPQLDFRWPGRYAMGLADDPGCSVLSLTSLGLVERSNHHYGKRDRTVALWRDARTGTRQLVLPAGDHGILLSLTRGREEEFTLDGRSDKGHAYQWELSGARPVRCSAPSRWQQT